jgi:hypothetical protein
MMKIASKNYENLPEVKKKMEQANKKQEMKQRMQNVKEFEKKRREILLRGKAQLKA